MDGSDDLKSENFWVISSTEERLDDAGCQQSAPSVLLGASGVGKSTVLRLFAGLAEGVTFTGDLSDPGRVAMMG